MLRCVIGTPFGAPVEPEVKPMYATSLAGSHSGPARPPGGGGRPPLRSTTGTPALRAQSRAAGPEVSSITAASRPAASAIAALRAAVVYGFSATTAAPSRRIPRYAAYVARLRLVSRPTRAGRRPRFASR